jgi:hypothetical protein
MKMSELFEFIQQLRTLEQQNKATFEVELKKEEIADISIDKLNVTYEPVGSEYSIRITQEDKKDKMEMFKMFRK